MMNKNFWGESDDIEPLPDWMLADTHKNSLNNKLKTPQTVEDAARLCLKKTPIDISNYSIDDDINKIK